MKCTCDEIGESTCKEHGYGLLECECGMRFTAPLRPKSFNLIMCPACGKYYAGQEESCGNGCWKKVGAKVVVDSQGLIPGAIPEANDDPGCYTRSSELGPIKELVMVFNNDTGPWLYAVVSPDDPDNWLDAFETQKAAQEFIEGILRCRDTDQK